MFNANKMRRGFFDLKFFGERFRSVDITFCNIFSNKSKWQLKIFHRF